MDPLIEGYRPFRADIWPGERARYEALAHWGQSPETMVVACSDSRVDPQTVFGGCARRIVRRSQRRRARAGFPCKPLPLGLLVTFNGRMFRLTKLRRLVSVIEFQEQSRPTGFSPFN